MKKDNHLSNFEQVQRQIVDKEKRKREFDLREKLYYKPHFGPEETDSQLDQEDYRIAQ